MIRTNSLVEILILGDININSKRNDNNTKLYNEFLKRNNLFNLIKSNTHFNAEEISVSAVDHVITTDPNLYTQHGIIPLAISDHYPVFGTRKKVKTKRAKTSIRARSYSKYDPAKLSVDLDNIDWTEVLNCVDPNLTWDLFVNKFTSLLDVHAPWKNMGIYLDTPPWLTHEFISKCKA